jgi:hypothetical protein
MGDTLVAFNIAIGSRSVEDRVMRLLSSRKGSDIIVSFFHGKNLLLIGGVVISLNLVGTIFLERTPVVGSGTLFSEGFRLDKPRSGVLVLLHRGREGVSLNVSVVAGDADQ